MATSLLLDRMFPDPLPSIQVLEERYPDRILPEGAMVTRIGPSPTGFMHIGTLYVGQLCAHFAKQTGGISMLRIEDTDKKRELAGAVEFITHAFDHFQISFDEGLEASGNEKGLYGPYRQSARREIYHAHVKYLLSIGAAYPCFSTADELSSIRDSQSDSNQRPGYYGPWAVWRDRSEADIEAQLDAGKPFVVRFRSSGTFEHKVEFDDLILGTRELPENDQDIVIMKSDGLPTYHFAHVVDDHLMRTTHVIRGDEWLASVPIHIELFNTLGWSRPAYAHIAPINKLDGASRRKLSKRKDPEASVDFFEQRGYPREAVLHYLMTLADAGFEVWKTANQEKSTWEFLLSFHGLQGSNGPLFDFAKLGNISRNYVSTLSSEAVYDQVLAWAAEFDEDLHNLMTSDPKLVHAVLSIEREGANVRKDIEQWSDVKSELIYFFDERFDLTAEQAQSMLPYVTSSELQALVGAYLDIHDPALDNENWFNGLKDLAADHGFAVRPKDFKKNPEAYKGTVSDVAKILRVLLTGKERTPDLFSIIKVMGADRVRSRLALIL